MERCEEMGYWYGKQNDHSFVYIFQLLYEVCLHVIGFKWRDSHWILDL